MASKAETIRSHNIDLTSSSLETSLDEFEAHLKAGQDRLFESGDQRQQMQIEFAEKYHGTLTKLGRYIKRYEVPMTPTLAASPGYMTNHQQWPQYKALLLQRLAIIERMKLEAMRYFEKMRDASRGCELALQQIEAMRVFIAGALVEEESEQAGRPTKKLRRSARLQALQASARGARI